MKISLFFLKPNIHIVFFASINPFCISYESHCKSQGNVCTSTIQRDWQFQVKRLNEAYSNHRTPFSYFNSASFSEHRATEHKFKEYTKTRITISRTLTKNSVFQLHQRWRLWKNFHGFAAILRVGTVRILYSCFL